MHALDHPNEEEQAPWSEAARLSDTLQEVVPQLGELAQPSGPVPAEAENAEQPPQSRKAALGRVKTVKEDTIQIWDYGELRYNPNTHTFRAHCHHPKHMNCSKQRTLRSGKRAGQGRPVGLLVAWLRDQANHDCHTSHSQYSAVAGKFDVRLKARQEFAALPNAAWWLSKERAKSADETHDEPTVVAD